MTKTKLSEEQEIKRDTMRSSAFLVWWANRKKISPVPSDPYRAFRIDRSLKAKLHATPIWKKNTNRSDSPLIDYPLGARGKKPRVVPRKQLKRKPSKKQLTKQEKRKLLYGGVDPSASSRDAQHKKKQIAHARKVLVQEGEKMAKHYGVPNSKLVFSSRDPRQYAVVHGNSKTGITETTIHLRSGKLTASKKLVMLHEKGHLVHARRTVNKADTLIAPDQSYTALHKLTGKGGQYQREKIAYKLAEPFIKKLPKGQQAVARWTKRRNLATYQQEQRLKAGTLKRDWKTGNSSMVIEFTDKKREDFLNWQKSKWS